MVRPAQKENEKHSKPNENPSAGLPEFLDSILFN
jgi:hypothetical protein